MSTPLSRQLIPPTCTTVPEPVKKAEQKLVATLAKVEHGRQAVRTAADKVEAAKHSDHSKATAAVGEGKQPPKAEEEQARHKLDMAQRGLAALVTEAEKALAVRDAAVFECAPPWIEAQNRKVEDSAAEVEGLLDRLGSAVAALEADAALAAALDERSQQRRPSQTARRWDVRPVATDTIKVRPDGSRVLPPKPVDPKPDKLVEALRDCVARLTPAKPEAVDAAEAQRREDFAEAQRQWRQLARGGVRP